MARGQSVLSRVKQGGYLRITNNGLVGSVNVSLVFAHEVMKSTD